jgi:hypothetical protein
MFTKVHRNFLSHNGCYLILFLLLPSFISSDSTQLAYRFLPGQVFRLNEHSSQLIKQSMMGKEQVTNSETHIDYIFKVISGSREEYLLDMEMDSIWFKMNISGEIVQGSSMRNQPKPGILARSLMEISKKHLKVHLSGQGDVLSVTGADTLFHSVINEYKQIPEQVRTALMEALDQRFGNETFQLELQNILYIYSPKSVKPGGHWQIEVPLAAGLPGITHNSWMLNEATDNRLNISCIGKITEPSKNDFDRMNGMLMKYELKGTRTASCQVDPQSGWIYSAKIKEDISGLVRMQASSKIQDAISWPISIEWTVDCIGNRLR